MDAGLMKITPNDAQRILNSMDYDGQRRIREDHVRFLAEEMEMGKFRQTAQITIAKQLDVNREYIVNGRHTLSAIIKCGIPQHVVYHEIETRDSLETAELYGTIDVNLSRTVYDQYSALKLGDQLGFNSYELKGLSSGVSFIESGFSKSNRARKHIHIHAEKLKEYAKFMHMFLDCVVGAPKEIRSQAHRGATVSVALVNYKYGAVAYGRDKIDQFWTGAIHGIELLAKDPRRLAHRHLGVSSMAGGGMTAGARTNVVSPAYSARYLANCFNAFVEGRELFSTKVPDPFSPMKINGSPFNGGDGK